MNYGGRDGRVGGNEGMGGEKGRDEIHRYPRACKVDRFIARLSLLLFLPSLISLPLSLFSEKRKKRVVIFINLSIESILSYNLNVCLLCRRKEQNK